MSTNYESDIKKLSGFKEAYTINGSLANLAIPTMQLLEDALRADAEFVNNIPKTYASVLKEGGPQAAQLQKAHATAMKAIQWYLKKREELLKEASEKSEKSLKEAQLRATQAVEKKQVAMFTQVDKSLDQVKNFLEHVRTMDYSIAKELDKTLTKAFSVATKACADAKKQMQDELLAQTQAPADLYSDTDKAEIEKAIRDAWKKKYPKDEILAVRFPNKSWVRDAIWRWRSSDATWYKNDTSVLRVNVIVKKDAKVATIYQAYVNKDMLSDEMNVGVDTKGSEYVVQEMLLENVK